MIFYLINGAPDDELLLVDRCLEQLQEIRRWLTACEHLKINHLSRVV